MLKIFLFSALWWGALVGRAAAQEEGGTFYVVQPGDTLAFIALRFDIAMDDLVAANGISDPNQVVAGTTLKLPGVDWVTGTLTVQDMPYGESLRSLSRRYHVTPEVLARLSRISNTEQLFVGYPAMLPTQRGEDLTSARAAVGGETTALELAVSAGINPWAIVGENQLAGSWEMVPGDVLLLPGSEGSGPGGLPSPISAIAVTSGNLVQGKTAVIRVQSGGAVSLGGDLVDHPLHFFEESPGGYVALQGLHALLEPGLYPLEISGTEADGTEFRFSQLMRVKSGNYGFETVTVDPAFLDPEENDTESAFVEGYVNEATPEKLWQGYFQLPSPFGETLNSVFGTRRSFNGSDFTYFHAGVDFGGGRGAAVLAPARGVVVFAGPLDVRGNATIINHGWGVYTGYWHQSEIYVQVGDVVEVGQTIGLVGDTGRVSGAHLHWEVWVGGVQVDPLDWLAYVYP